MDAPQPHLHRGATLTALSILPFVWNAFVSLRKGKVAGDDPWEGNSLE
jgi:heme/copper-type cytochrome/quinol oxidase subunit 1